MAPKVSEPDEDARKEFLKKLHELMRAEYPLIKLVSATAPITLYEHTEQKGVPHDEAIGRLLDAHPPGNPNIKYTIYDKDGLIDTTQEIIITAKKTSLNQCAPSEKRALKDYYTKGTTIHFAIPSLNPRLFFKDHDWHDALEFWLNGGTTKDHRLIKAFKSCVVPLPDDHIKWQPLNAHQIWLTNSGTGKSTFNVLYGKSVTTEFTGAGLFGSNSGGSYVGALNGKGMFMIDEVSALTNKSGGGQDDIPLMAYLLSYLEQGEVVRTFKSPVICQGTKTVILNSNPRHAKDTLLSMKVFTDLIGGEEDKVRLGRRFGLLVAGNDFKTVKTAPMPLDEIRFIQRIIHSTIMKNWKSVLSMYEHELGYLALPDPDLMREIRSIANSEDISYTGIAPLLQGIALATPKLKTAAFRTFILDHLDMLEAKKTKDMLKLWKEMKYEYIDELYQINLSSFNELKQASTTLGAVITRCKLMRNTKEAIKLLTRQNLTTAEIAQQLGITKQLVYYHQTHD